MKEALQLDVTILQRRRLVRLSVAIAGLDVG